jgi:8-oxo-dGTP pyrophosphatase MutT (NUDIX family)
MARLKTNVAEYALILNDKDEILLVQWGDEYENTWHFPGGRLDEGDKAIGGLKREVKEELGVEIDVLRPVYTKYVTKKECKYMKESERYAVFYLAKVKEGEEIKLVDGEHVAFRWFKKSELKDVKFFMNFYKEMLEKVL